MAAATRNGRGNKGTEWLRARIKQVGFGSELPVSTEVAAAVDVEAWLQQHNVQYAPPALIPMGLIDERRSRSNQSRKEAIVGESVDRFAVAMKLGTVFPPIVVYPDGGSLVIVDGNNRQAAARRTGAEYILGIVIAEDTPSEVLHLLTVEANARHGVTPELSWRVQQAFGLCAMGWPDSEAARAAGLSISQLRAARTVQDADQRARGLRLAGFADLPASSKTALVALKDDKVFNSLARLAVATGMTTDEIREVTRAVKALASEEARLEYVDTVAKARTVQRVVKRDPGKHSRLHSPKVTILSSIGRLLSVDATDLARQAVTTHDRDIILQRVADAEAKLALVRVALAATAVKERV